MTPVKEDPEFPYQIWKSWENECLLGVIEAELRDVYPEQGLAFFDNFAELLPQADEMTESVEKVDEDGGFAINRFVQKDVPLISQRCWVAKAVPVSNAEEDTHELFNTEQGCEPFKEKHCGKDFAGDMVVGTMHLQYFQVSPLKDASGEVAGSKLRIISHFNVNGHIPDVVIDALAAKTYTEGVVGVKRVMATL